MALTLSGDGSIGPLSATEVGYLDGVTSAVQTQINSKLTTPGTWTSYTPALVNIALGNGAITARYAQIGKTITFSIRFAFGSTSSVTNSPAFSLPVTSVSSSVGMGGGHAMIVDAGTTYPTPAALMIADQYATIRAVYAASTYIGVSDMSATIPWTWAVNDIILISGTYEAA